MQHLLIVAAGGAIGAGTRHLVNVAALRLVGTSFPWGTLAINIAGSFLMGIIVEVLARSAGASAELRLFIATGVLGGFTTFSAFSLETALLWERGTHLAAIAYVTASMAGAIAALFAGLWLARSLG